jgi:hypothetical protein
MFLGKRSADASFGDLTSFLPTEFGKKKARHDLGTALESTRKKKVSRF